MGCTISRNVVNSPVSPSEAFKGQVAGSSRGRHDRNNYQRDPTTSVTSTDPSDRPRAPALEPGKKTLLALHDYECRVEGDLSFKKGELLEMLDQGADGSNWWQARHADGRQGYVPCNFVAVENTLESQDWYFGNYTRRDSERALKSPKAGIGSFLVRASETSQHSMALSVRDRADPRTGEIIIRHYKIRHGDDGSCFIASRRRFPNYLELVKHYRGRTGGVCQKLTQACPRPAPVTGDLGADTRDRWEIDRRCLTFEVKLGAGQFGEVWKGKYRGYRDVAIKTLKPDTMSPSKFLEEAQIMKQCQHDKLVRLYAVCTDVEPIYIVTELMSNGSLQHYLRSRAGHYVPMVTLIDMISQVASGMWYLERQQYIHRDLAARNVLVGENNIVKVADFGLARLIEDGEYNPEHGSKFPIKWTAPEAALYGKFTTKADVWSFGVLVYEVMTKGQTPYPGMNNREVLEQVDRGYRMKKPPSTPKPVYRKMMQCWHREPSCRPTFQHLNDFFDEYPITSEENYGTIASR